MATLKVGTGGSFPSIAAAVSAARPGDTIEINAGTYVAQDIKLTNSVTIESAGNGPVVVTDRGYLTKGLFIAGTSAAGPNVVIQGLTLEGARATAGNGGNGAGIRYQSGNLTLIDDTFLNNQEGILATPFTSDTGTIIVQGSTFNHNGSGTGQTHNIYIAHVADFSISDSLIENAVVGHEIKTRAYHSEIVGNVIIDGPAGTASYEIDLPNGGNAVIQGNTIEQGPKSQNPWIIAYGEEYAWQPGSLTVTGNLIVNDLPTGRGIHNVTPAAAIVAGNQTYGLTASQLLSGSGNLIDNAALSAEPAIKAADPSGPTMVFLGGSTPSSQVIYATAANQVIPPPSSTGGIKYEIAPGGTGTLTISNFRTGLDSLQLAQGVTVAHETISSGMLDIALSNMGTVVIATFS